MGHPPADARGEGGHPHADMAGCLGAGGPSDYGRGYRAGPSGFAAALEPPARYGDRPLPVPLPVGCPYPCSPLGPLTSGPHVVPPSLQRTPSSWHLCPASVTAGGGRKLQLGHLRVSSGCPHTQRPERWPLTTQPMPSLVHRSLWGPNVHQGNAGDVPTGSRAGGR